LNARSASWSRRPRSDTRTPETLRGLYERYCEVEAAELLRLLPREGLRSLWRHGMADEPSVDRMREIARDVLPLPPYELWVQSYLDNRRSYLDRLGIPAAPSRPDPVTVSTRPVREDLWAHLNLSHRDGEWFGYISFHGRGSGLRTTDIFRGEDPAEIRDRFEGFTGPTLEAFLRSVAP
jgi:hypothetical protein